MIKSYGIDTYYSSGSYSSKTRHAINIGVAIENSLKEDIHAHNAKFITFTWNQAGGSQGQSNGSVIKQYYDL